MHRNGLPRLKASPALILGTFTAREPATGILPCRLFSPTLRALLQHAMIQIVNRALDLISNAGELTATIAAIVRGFGELFQALRTILRLIGSLAGG